MTDRADHPAWTDTLTRAGNRRLLYAWLRESARPGAVILADLDRLADLNASLGRRQADAVIAESALRLSRLLQEGDLLVRHGPDEFAMILPGRSRQEAFELAEGICAAFASSNIRLPESGQAVRVSLSLGVAASAADVSLGSPDLARARRALAAAKAAGRGLALHDQSVTAARPETDPWAGFPCSRVVGREVPLDELAASTGKLPRVVLIHGPPGIGKTRFLRAAVDRLRGDRAAGAAVAVDDAARFSPFRALGDLLELVAAKHPRVVQRARERLDPEQVTVVRAISPGFFGEAAPAAPMPSTEKAAGAVVAIVNAARDLHPAWILALDEAPLADHASLETLQTVLTGYPAPVLLLLAADSADGTAGDGVDTQLPAILGSLRGRRRLSELALPALDSAGVKAMIEGLLPGANPSEAFAEALGTACGGVPLYVEEALRDLLASGKAGPEGDAWRLPEVEAFQLPPTLKHSVVKTFLQLPAPVRDLVNHAAVLGAKFDIDLLQEVLGLGDLEFFERLDALLNQRLLRPMDPSVPEVLEFASTYSRTVAYESLDPLARRRVHLRIGTVLAAQEEEAFAGSDLEFHLERCGASDEAAAIRRRTGRRGGRFGAGAPVRVTRIPEGSDALTPAAAAAMETALKSLAGAVKTARLYPQHNRVKDDFLRAFLTSLGTALDAAPAVTVRLEEGNLRLNGAGGDARPGGPQAELARFLDDRHLAAMTFTRGLAPEEAQALLEGLAAPIDPGRVPSDHWDRWLGERRLAHADLVQRAFVARAGETMARLKRAELVERPLEEAELAKLALALRHLRTASDSLKLYPPGHAQVEESFRQAVQGFADLLEAVEPVSIGSAEGKIVVNGRAADPRAMGSAGQAFADEIAARDLKSLTLVRGLTDEELRALASYFSLPRDQAAAAAADLVGRPDFRHFQFGALLFRQKRSVTQDQAAAATESTTFIVKLEDGDGRPVRLRRGARADVRARLLLGQDPSRLTEEKTARAFPALLEALNYGSTCDLAAQLTAHLGSAARQGTVEHRAKAWRLLQDTLDDATRETARLLVSMSSPAVRDVLASESEADLLRAAGDLLPAFVKAAVETRTTGALRDVLREGLEKRRRDAASPPAIRDWMAGLARRLAISPAMKLLLARLSDPSRDERRHATALVAALGDSAIASLTAFLFEERTPHGRQAAAETLAKIGPDAAKLLLDRAAAAPPAGLVAALDVAELLGPDAIGTLFRIGAAHAEAPVRDAAAGMVRRVRQAAVPALRHGLGDPATRMLCLKLGTELKLGGLGPEAGRLIEDSEDADLLGQVCRYAAAAEEGALAGPLGRVLNRRGGLLRRGLPDAVRGDAAWALAQIPTTEAQHLAREAEKDSSPVVRGAARSGRAPVGGQRPGR